MAVNDELLERTIRHQLYLSRLQSLEAARVRALLNAAIPQLLVKVQERLEVIAAKGFDPGPATTRRLKQLATGLVDIVDPPLKEARIAFAKEMNRVADQESKWAAGVVQKTIPVDVEMVLPSPVALRAMVNTEPIVGLTLNQWWDNLAATTRKNVTQAVQQGVVQGQTTQEIVQVLRRDVFGLGKGQKAKGMTRQAQAIARTATNHASTQARAMTYRENSDIIKGEKWVSTLDSRTTPICQRLDGQVFFYDRGRQPPGPPAHVGCLPGDALVTPCGRISNATKRWFQGDLIVIRTADGLELSSTPNHPVLTRRGWLSARLLQKGDRIVRGVLEEGPSTGVVGEHQGMPTPIGEIWEACLVSDEMIAAVVPTSPEDFHGDGEQGEVAIVGTDRPLGLEVEAPRSEPALEVALMCSDMGLMPVPCLRSEDALLGGLDSTRNGGVGSPGKALPLSGTGAAHPGELLLRAVADVDAPLEDGTLDGTWRDAEVLRDACDADTGAVLLDDVVEVGTEVYHGFVYNLQTESGRYVANGIVNHNCRSSLSPVTKSWRELGIKAKELPEGTRASMNGQVPASTNYNQWLRGRVQAGDMATVREALGPTRAKLFAAGGLDVTSFTDRRGRLFTLAELRRREADVFDRLNIRVPKGT